MTPLDKLLSMGGRELFVFLQDALKKGKIKQAATNNIYEAWLEKKGWYKAGVGWRRYDEIDENDVRSAGL